MSEFEKLRYTRQANFDINQKELIDFDFDGLKKKVYGNCNLSIFVDDFCNADCKFCVAQLRYENVAKIYKKETIKNTNEYYKRLDKVLTKLEPLNLSVSLTGGEPTASPKLLGILELLEKHNMRKRTITTNGSYLLHKINGESILDLLIKYNFDHLNISKTHYDDNINRKIMRYREGYCSNEDLARIILYALERKLRPRLSCLLLKSGISTMQDIENYIQFYEKLGIDNVIFRELMDYDEKSMSNIEKMKYCKENKVVLNNIWKEIDKNPKFVPIKNILGYYYYVEIYQYNNVVVCSESADLKKLYAEKAKHKDKVYEMVFHPNGNLNGSWVDNEDILMKYE
ncbi:MAG: radical SAM protein [Candidatus Dojkabacteria bacterium]|jgi:cyclic pyranopterin phosphate synthase